MRRVIPALTAALLSAATYSVYAADEPTDSNSPSSLEKLAKQRKSESQQAGNPADQAGQGAPKASQGGDVKQGSDASGRGDATGTTMTPNAAPKDQSGYNK